MALHNFKENHNPETSIQIPSPSTSSNGEISLEEVVETAAETPVRYAYSIDTYTQLFISRLTFTEVRGITFTITYDSSRSVTDVTYGCESSLRYNTLK